MNAEVVVVQMRAVKAGLDVLVDGKAVVAVPTGDQIAENQPAATAVGVHAVVGEIFRDDVVDDDIVVVEEDDATGLVGAVKFLFGGLFVAFGAIIL